MNSISTEDKVYIRQIKAEHLISCQSAQISYVFIFNLWVLRVPSTYLNKRVVSATESCFCQYNTYAAIQVTVMNQYAVGQVTEKNHCTEYVMMQGHKQQLKNKLTWTFCLLLTRLAAFPLSQSQSLVVALKHNWK